MRGTVLTGVIALALAAGPAWAQGHGNGHGNGGNGGGGEVHGNGGGEHGRGNAGGQDPGNGGGEHGHGEHGPRIPAFAGNADAHGHGNARRERVQVDTVPHGNGAGRGRGYNEHGDHGMRSSMHAAGGRAEHGRERAEAARPESMRPRAPSHEHEQGARVERGNVAQPIAPRAVRERNNFPQVAATNSEHHRRSDDDATRLRQVFATHSGTAIDGCPPGLAAKQNGCRPPGLARQADAEWRRRLYEPAWWGLNGVAGGPYYYGDGYLYRLDNAGTVASYIPLLAGALAIGNQWPSSYAPVELPSYYQRYYGLGPLDSYRYADNTIYDVDPTSSVISSIAALLTGDDFTVGQRLPVGYDVYNVPYPYRGQYADTPDAWYRYSDGYVYQVDPKTRLIQEAIQLLGA